MCQMFIVILIATYRNLGNVLIALKEWFKLIWSQSLWKRREERIVRT